MKITKYEQRNIKGSSVSLTIGEVTLLTGPNRSSKTSKLEGIALAATGRSSIGATAAKMAELIGPNDYKASSRILLDTGEVAQWNIKQSDTNGKVTNSAKHDGPDVFGSFVTPNDFWGLTGEEKWKTIGSLVTGQSQEIEHTANSVSQATGIKLRGNDLLSKLSNLQSDIAAHLAVLNQQAKLASMSLTAPEEYTGEPLRDLLKKRAEADAFILAQTASRKTKREREERAVRRNRDLETLRETASNAQAIAEENKIVAEHLRYAAEHIRPLASKLAEGFRQESELVAQCRITPIGTTLHHALSFCLAKLNSARDVPISTLSDRCISSGIADQLTVAIDALTTCVNVLQDEATLRALDSTLPIPEEVAQINELLEAAPTKWRPKTIDEYASADAFLTHDITVVESAQRKTEATAASAQAEIARLEAQEAIDKATNVELCSEEEFLAKLSYIDSLNKLIAKAQEWPDFLAKQEGVADTLDKIKAEVDKLNGNGAMIRKLREQLLKSASTPIEQYANQLVVACGLEPLELTVTSTDKTSALSIQTASGVDLSVLCGAEKIVYGLAILMAIQHFSPAPCPIRLIECAELDPDTLTRLLDALVKIKAKGTTVLASWVTPAQLPQGVTVVDCTRQQRTSAEAEVIPAAPTPAP